MPKFQGLDYAHPIDIRSVVPSEVTELMGLGRVVVTPDAQRWDLTIGLEVVREKDAHDYFLHRSQNGLDKKFTLEMPQWEGTTHSGSATIASASTGATSLTTAGTSGVSKGRFITIAGDTKVYVVTADKTSGAAGTISIFPSLRVAITSAQAINFTPNITAYYARDGIEGMSTNARGLIRLLASFEEAV